MIFYYHLFIVEVWTIRNETTYPIHGKYPLNRIFPSVYLEYSPKMINFAATNGDGRIWNGQRPKIGLVAQLVRATDS